MISAQQNKVEINKQKDEQKFRRFGWYQFIAVCRTARETKSVIASCSNLEALTQSMKKNKNIW